MLSAAFFLVLAGTAQAQQTLTANSHATVTINSGKRVQLRFTAPSAGDFTFESTNNGSLDPVAFANSPDTWGATRNTIINDDGGNGNNFRFMRKLSAGEVFTFFAGVRNDNRVNGTYTVSVQGIQAATQTQTWAGSGNRNDAERTIDRFLQEFYDRHQYRGGISLAITRRERLVYTGAVGFADRNHTVRLTPQHRMRLASVSKPITSVAIAKLSEEGRLSLDGKVFGRDGIFRNALGMPTYNRNPVDVTVRQILEHKSGFKRDILANNRYNYVVDRNTTATPLDFLPGAETVYSNYAYNILGRIIETVTGMPYERYVKEHILKPCGIDGMRVGADAPGPDEVEYIGDNLTANPLNNAPGPSGGWVASPIELMKFMAHVDGFSNVPDILRSDTPRIGVHSHSGRLSQGTWTILQRDSDGFSWALLMNYVPPNFEQIDRPALFRQIKNAIREWPLGTDLSGVSGGDISGVRTPYNDFYSRVLSYRFATGNMEIVVNENITLNNPINIEAPWTAGAALTIRSANRARPVTLTRGTSGDLFTVSSGATLIFRDIIIDGGSGASGRSGGAFANNGGGTLVRVNGGSFTMNAGAVLRNNANSGSTSAANGGGVVVNGNTAAFTMSGGEIIGNTSGFEAGGVYVNSGSTFTMTGGKINGNTANNNPGGVYVRDSTFTMRGGEIIGNTSATISGVRVLRSTFTLTGGVVAGTGTAITNVVNGTYNLNTASPKNAVVIAWNRASGTSSEASRGTLNYTAGSNTHLTLSQGATATWANQGGVLGISYANGSNKGWIRQW